MKAGIAPPAQRKSKQLRDGIKYKVPTNCVRNKEKSDISMFNYVQANTHLT